MIMILLEKHSNCSKMKVKNKWISVKSNSSLNYLTLASWIKVKSNIWNRYLILIITVALIMMICSIYFKWIKMKSKNTSN